MSARSFTKASWEAAKKNRVIRGAVDNPVDSPYFKRAQYKAHMRELGKTCGEFWKNNRDCFNNKSNYAFLNKLIAEFKEAYLTSLYDITED